MHTGVEIGLVLLLILVNGAFAMSEIALVSARRARLDQRVRKGSRGAAAAIGLIEEPNLFLSTVQIGITFVGTFAGAFGGATIARELAVMLGPVPYIGARSDAVALAVVVAAITYTSLVIGELVPKRLGLSRPEAIAAAVARPMRAISVIARPLVAVLSASTDLVLKFLPVRPGSEPPVTEGEIRSMIAHGARTGVLHATEREMLEGVFRLGDRRAVELMTPRNQVLSIDVLEPLADTLSAIKASPFSCFPAVRGGLDNVAGMIEGRTLIGLEPGQIRLEDHLKKAVSVPENYSALRLVDLFRDTRSSMALVVDDHGQTVGVVTVMDLLEAIVGDLPQFGEEYEPRIVSRYDGSLLVDGRMPMGELNDRLHREPAAAEGRYVTLGGFVMQEMGRVPSIGDSFVRFGYRFEVVDMDGLRVDRVLISRAADTEAGRND